METTLVVIGATALLMMLLMSAPAPRTRVIYMPIETSDRREGWGCLPVLVLGIIFVLLLAAALH